MTLSAASFVLRNLRLRHGRQWLSGPREPRPPLTFHGQALIQQLIELGFELTQRQREKLTGLEHLTQLFRHYRLRGLVHDSHEGLLAWLEGRYPLEAREDIPTPQEMLAIQCQGRRYVTLLLKPEEQFQRYGRHRDACDFLLHDFEHAHKFFADPDSFRGQVRFFRALRASLEAFSAWRHDPGFNASLDYLMADMNSHPVHLMKYLKAIVLKAEIARSGRRDPELEPFWRALFSAWDFDGETLVSALTLNQPERESPHAQRRVADFFMACSPRLEASR